MNASPNSMLAGKGKVARARMGGCTNPNRIWGVCFIYNKKMINRVIRFRTRSIQVDLRNVVESTHKSNPP